MVTIGCADYRVRVLRAGGATDTGGVVDLTAHERELTALPDSNSGWPAGVKVMPTRTARRTSAFTSTLPGAFPAERATGTRGVAAPGPMSCRAAPTTRQPRVTTR